jgi:vanillate O-demethylase ferredoxin subunit
VLHADDEAGTGLDLATALASPVPGEHLYVCGPPGLIAATLAAATSAGWPDSAVHRESFSPVASDGADTAFALTLARSGLTLQVPADRTALDVLLEHGVAIDSACEQGVCGTCVTRVLAGEPDHRDQWLSAQEHAANDCFTPCCSRARSAALVLDL